MLTQARIKHIRSLQQKKFRNEFNQFIAEGPKLVEELITSKYSFNCIYAKKEWMDLHLEEIQKKEIPFEEINNYELERISKLTTPNMVLAVLNTPCDPMPDEIIGKELILVLDEIKDPGNMGTIIRTADWFGIEHIICSENTVDVYNPKVVQATMGSLARVNIYYTSLLSLLKEHNSEVIVYGAFHDGVSIHDVDLEQNGIILIGNESNGISKDIRPLIHQRISIPMYSIHNEKNPESLNASIAAAIILYEFMKRKV